MGSAVGKGLSVDGIVEHPARFNAEMSEPFFSREGDRVVVCRMTFYQFGYCMFDGRDKGINDLASHG